MLAALMARIAASARLGRGEIRLADAEADDVLALTRERLDFGEHDERVLGAEEAPARRLMSGRLHFRG